MCYKYKGESPSEVALFMIYESLYYTSLIRQKHKDQLQNNKYIINVQLYYYYTHMCPQNYTCVKPALIMCTYLIH